MNVPAALANGLWFLSCLPEAYALWRSRSRVRETQLRVLRRTLRGNRDSAFGRARGFEGIRSLRQYRSGIPERGWETFSEQVRRIMAGEGAVLTEEPVLLFEPTGGSAGAAKLVPYTRALKREFSRGIDAWVFHLFAWKPLCLMGSHYFSITPFGAARGRTPAGIPIGFEDDRDYLGGLMRRLSGLVMAAPRELASIQDPDAFRWVTLLFLLKRADLCVVSIWNPAFFTLLLEPLRRHGPGLARDLAAGRIEGTAGLEPRLRRILERKLGRNPRRAAELSRILDRNLPPGVMHSAIWPRLRVISCWADGNASAPAAALSRLFPRAAVQPKGLLSTEGFVSLPLGGRVGAALSIRSHFYEFLDGSRPGQGALGAQELLPGRRYEVVLTTGGGLYRYRTRDEVEVTGHWGGIPLLRFLGRNDAVSDMFGEKLSEEHVRSAVEESLARFGIRPAFWIVAPERDGTGGGFYVFFVELSSARPGASPARPGTPPARPGAPPAQTDAPAAENLLHAARGIEERLRENPQYEYCIRLGQLRPLKVFLIEDAGAEAYLRFCVKQGQRLGDVKPAALMMKAVGEKAFNGRYLERGAAP